QGGGQMPELDYQCAQKAGDGGPEGGLQTADQGWHARLNIVGVELQQTQSHTQEGTKNTGAGENSGRVGGALGGIARTDEIERHERDQGQEHQRQRGEVKQKIHRQSRASYAAGSVAYLSTSAKAPALARAGI